LDAQEKREWRSERRTRGREAWEGEGDPLPRFSGGEPAVQVFCAREVQQGFGQPLELLAAEAVHLPDQRGCKRADAARELPFHQSQSFFLPAFFTAFFTALSFPTRH